MNRNKKKSPRKSSEPTASVTWQIPVAGPAVALLAIGAVLVLLAATMVRAANEASVSGLKSPPPTPVLPAMAHDYSFPTWPRHYTENRLDGPNQLAAIDALRPGPSIDPSRLNEIATLGRVIFYDRSLSANQLVSCASCHSQDLGFDDPSRFSIGFDGRITSRHSMGLANAVFNASGGQFSDERAGSLDEMMLHPFFDQVEMGLNPESLIKAVDEREYYVPLFANAYGNAEINTRNISMALATFVRAMVSIDSDYDREAARTDNPLIDFPGFSKAENRGKFLFFETRENGGAGCGTCHVSEAFLSHPGGAANIGLDLEYLDRGAGAVANDPSLDGAFRSASLKNIAIRPPYMHDGRFDTLEAVIEHYDNGVQAHPNLHESLRDASGAPIRLGLSTTDKAALVAFLKTLTDEAFLRDRRFSNPFLTKPNNQD